MLKLFKLIILCIFFNFRNCVSAQTLKETVVNEILFSTTDESSTVRDSQVFQSVLSQVFQKNRISQFTKKPLDDFILSRLSYKEAVVFGLEGTENKMNEAMKKKLSEFSQVEINREIEVISKALALIEIKETQLKGKDRFDTWFEIVKHKYQVKLKFSEMK